LTDAGVDAAYRTIDRQSSHGDGANRGHRALLRDRHWIGALRPHDRRRRACASRRLFLINAQRPLQQRVSLMHPPALAINTREPIHAACEVGTAWPFRLLEGFHLAPHQGCGIGVTPLNLIEPGQ